MTNKELLEKAINTKIQFEKDDYIVTLEGDFKDISCAKKNYCFKIRESCLYLKPCIDLNEKNGNSNIYLTFNKSNVLKDWRYATKEEIAEYDKLGKPYDINTLKRKSTSKFQVGDKVRFKKPDSTNAVYFKKGLTNLTVKEVRDNTGYCSVYESDKSTDWNVRQDELELDIDTQNGFEIGRWYKGDPDYYIKVQKVEPQGKHNKILGETISRFSGFTKNNYWCNIDFEIEALKNGPLTDLSEIQKFLPNDHPDKMITFEVGEWYQLKNHQDYYVRCKSVNKSIKRFYYDQYFNVIEKKYYKDINDYGSYSDIGKKIEKSEIAKYLNQNEVSNIIDRPIDSKIQRSYLPNRNQIEFILESDNLVNNLIEVPSIRISKKQV